MRLLQLAHEGFRNLEAGAVELSPATTVLLGDNGQGKTSFLEAVGVLATAKSFRGARAPELVRHGERSFFLRGTVDDAGHQLDLTLGHAEGRRLTTVGRSPTELADYIAHLTVVPITQTHAGIVRAGPQDRRDFLDRGLLGVRPAYLRSLSAYRRTLKQVNALLRAGGDGPTRRTQLAAWLDRLAVDGAEIVARRRVYVRDLRAALADVGPTFQPPGEELTLELSDVVARAPEPLPDPDRPSRDAVAALLRERLEATLERSLAHRQAVVGPHRDELVLTLAGRDARRFASSGQQRNALLALKMAKIEVFRRHRDQTPVLLVDDVDTEIDARRLGRFLEGVGGRSQAILTSSKLDLFRSTPADAVVYRVRGGVVTRE